jgi:hypothetical protein
VITQDILASTSWTMDLRGSHISTMKRLFSPCNRLHDLIESQGVLEEPEAPIPERLQEVNLDVSTEEFLSAERAFTFADLYGMLGSGHNMVAWLTPRTAFVGGGVSALETWESLGARETCCLLFSADGKEIFAMALSPEHLLEICDVVLRLLAVSVVHALFIEEWSRLEDALINTPTLANFMEQCQSLKALSLKDLRLDENHCRVLGAYTRPGLEIVLTGCKITDAGASALAEVLGRNQGPTEIVLSYFDNLVLANGLRGNSRLKILRPRFSNNRDVVNREVLEIAGALKKTKAWSTLILVMVPG